MSFLASFLGIDALLNITIIITESGLSSSYISLGELIECHIAIDERLAWYQSSESEQKNIAHCECDERKNVRVKDFALVVAIKFPGEMTPPL